MVSKSFVGLFLFMNIKSADCEMLTLHQTCARMSVGAGLSGLAGLPSLSQEEQVRGWLEDTEMTGQRPDNFGCDCFQPDNVHYACTDVTVLPSSE